MTAEFAAMAHPAALPTGAAARPRVSAESFRNLAARLKKPDAVIPAVAPVISAVPPAQPAELAAPVAVQPAPTPEPLPSISVAPIAEETFAPAVVSVAEAVMQLDPPAEPAASLLPEPDQPAAPSALQPSPVLEELTPVEVLPLELTPEVETPEVYATEVYTPEPLVTETIVVEDVWQPEAPPVAEVQFEPVMHVESVMAEATSTPELQGSFAENFTYVPEGGESEVAPPPLAKASDAEDPEVAERAIQLELENIWRLLLAKPTADDRALYLREAALHHAADEEWNKPAPEHDLSLIEPSLEPVTEELAVLPVDETGVRSLQDSLPVAEGQDLAELSRSLLDMMAQGASSGLPHERALAADTLLRLVPRLELKPLVVLAQRLAMMDNPPNLLVSRLIRDTRVEVAGPLLEDCPHISDKDLESVVTEAEPAKLRMIARRRHLTRAISDALIRSGEPSVVLTLVRNMEAEISHDGFQSLLVLCENNDELMAPLATRQDLGAPFAFELFWLAPPQLRRFILSRFLTDSETLTKILKITMATNNDDEGEAEPLSQHALLEALERAARGHVEVAVNELAQIMQLSPATITRILGDLQGDAIVVMLKAAAYPRSAVTGLLKRMQDADMPLVTRDRDVVELQTMFETLSFNKARILLTYWDWAQAKTGPYAPVH